MCDTLPDPEKLGILSNVETKLAVVNAVADLMEETPLDKLTVNQICNASGISHGKKLATKLLFEIEVLAKDRRRIRGCPVFPLVNRALPYMQPRTIGTPCSTGSL